MSEDPDNTTPIAVRIEICKLAIKTLKEDAVDDPRQPEALRYYEAQLAHLLEKQASMPAPTVINLKAAQLGAVPQGFNKKGE